MIKIAYSSVAAPGWDLDTLVTKAAEYGYDGLELRGLSGELYLPVCPALTRDPASVRNLLAEHKIELICLGSSAVLTARSREAARQKASIIEYMELAASLGCPAVRVYVGDVGRWERRATSLARAASMLQSLVPIAVRNGVTILVENGGDFPGSADLWYLIDAVSHPAVRSCWNQCSALTIRERPTNSLPRLGNKIGMVHICDAAIDDSGLILEYKPLGEGDAEVARQIMILKGLVYNRYVTFDWPKLWWNDLASPEDILPRAAELLREKISEKQDVLTAYKNDKNAPRLASLSAS
jgi:sugar phosphate isomerase/epimerase